MGQPMFIHARVEPTPGSGKKRFGTSLRAGVRSRSDSSRQTTDQSLGAPLRGCCTRGEKKRRIPSYATLRPSSRVERSPNRAQSRRPQKPRSLSLYENFESLSILEAKNLRSTIVSRNIELIARIIRLLRAGNEHADMPPHFYWSFTLAGLWLRVGVLAFVLALTHSSRAVA